MRSRFSLPGFLALSLMLPGLARGQAAPAYSQPTMPSGALADPNIDRSFVMPTAETQPKGALVFNDYELLLMGLTYGVTDNFQITGTTLVPIARDMPLVIQGSLKFKLLDTSQVKLAAMAGAWILDDNDSGENDDEAAIILNLGGVASFCLDAGCDSMLSAGVTAAKGRNVKEFVDSDDGTQNDDIGFVYGATLLTKIGRHAKLVLEADSAFSFAGRTWESADGFLLNYGVRFFTQNIAGDIGFLKPIGEDVDSDLLLGWPFINFTYRSM
ncbi:MAG: hypothetical protein HY698_12305 [Deltaproteobacteria bacterium]|nr:hypothetical protein [Deltaproteobacteria bacterium]